MSVQTSTVGGQPADSQQVPAGGPETGAGGVTGNSQTVAPITGTPDQRAGQSKGKPGPDTPGEGKSSQTTGLQKAFESGPEAGDGGVTGNSQAVAPITGTPDHTAGQPKGKLDSSQSNDNLPQWTQQLSKKLTADPQSAAILGEYKNLEDFIQGSLAARIQADKGQLPSVPGKDSSPQDIQAFYELLGKPQKAEEYTFAKSDPDFAAFAYGANLTADQADSLYRASLAQVDHARNAAQAALAQDYQSTDALLRTEYGERYDEAIALMGRGMGNNPKTGELSTIAQSLVAAGLAGKPEIVRAFIELGRAVSEGAAPGGSYRALQAESVTQGRGFNYQDDY